MGCGESSPHTAPATPVSSVNSEEPKDVEQEDTPTTLPAPSTDEKPTPEPETSVTPPEPPPVPENRCQHAGPSANFDQTLDPLVWKTYGSARWESLGYLELTGNAQGQKGAIFNIADKVSPGDVSISVRLWTGGGTGTGADGFAMSIVGVNSVDELNTLMEAAKPGGGMGYAYGEGYSTYRAPALHVEFDTWENRIIPNGDLFDDPTSEDHVAVTLDGNPGAHYLWGAVPDLEEQRWHQVVLHIRSEHLKVTLDEHTVLEGDIPGFRFKGGFIGFTGSTGYYTNYHKIDDLQIPCVER
jgi:hypothetical protein